MIGGVLLEATGRIRPTVTAAVVSTAIYGVTTLFFAFTGNYAVALIMLFISGVANLASMSIGQTVVQLLRPGPGPRPGGRPVRGVGQRAAGRQRVHRRPARRGDRRSTGRSG